MSDTKRNGKGAISRRDFLRFATAGSLGLTIGGLLAACQASSAPQPTAKPAAPTPASAQAPAPAPTKAPAPQPTPAPKVAVGGTVTVGLGSDPSSLDPHQTGDQDAQLVYLHIFDPLYRLDDKGNRVPEVAEGLKQGGDESTWLVSIRKGIKFHDGTPLNADAVVKSFKRHMDPKAKRDRSGLPDFKAIEAADEYTVKFVTEGPYGAFRNAMTIRTGAIVSPAAVAKYGEQLTENPIGSGAFKYKDRVRGDRVTLEANPDYRKGRPKIDQIVWRTVKEDATRIMMLEAGEIDVALRIPPPDLERVKSNPNLTILTGEAMRLLGVVINLKRKPFDDIRVRHALNYAVDKKAIVDKVLKGTAIVTQAPVVPKVWGYSPQPLYDYNPEKAKQLLKEAGAEGATVRILSPQGKEPFDRQVAEAVHGMLLAVGLKAEIQVMGDFPTYRTMQQNGEFDLCMDGIGITDGDANQALSEPFDSRFAGKPGGKNFSRYVNPKFDQLLAAGRTTVDEAKRKEIYAEAQKIVWADAPNIWLHCNNMYYAVRKQVQGVILTAEDKLDLRGAWRQA